MLSPALNATVPPRPPPEFPAIIEIPPEVELVSSVLPVFNTISPLLLAD